MKHIIKKLRQKKLLTKCQKKIWNHFGNFARKFLSKPE